ncbi:Bug family tripartite tricarboxylate transporter substrate binding protein [Cupriavidus sp. 2TAF22]|uniref:Bug family tripartite tricarboxylate transporter substrate binding protein n=1 Tax=unclassified Cupriavidus TaxID=2640874 RepID=UPI003F92D13C
MSIAKRFAAVAVLLAAPVSLAWAQGTYPSKPIRLIVGFPPGGGADAVARVVAERMSRELGQTIVIDNKPGAGTTIAAEAGARAEPDGYTLFMGSANIFGSDRVLYRNIRYDGQKDFTAISRWTIAPMVLTVNKDLGVKTVQDLVAKARQNPGKFFYASSGSGGAPHMAGVYFNKLSGTRMEHVPFKGGAPAVTAVISGDAQLIFGTPPSVLPMVEAGKLQALAVTSEKRSPLLPKLPSVAEGGLKGYDLTFWFGLFGPAGLPPAVVQKLFVASQKALGDPEVVSKLAAQGNEALASASPQEFRQWAIAEGAKTKQLVEQSGAKLD